MALKRNFLFISALAFVSLSMQADFNKVHSLLKKYADILNRGLALAESGRYKEAIPHLEKVTRFKADNRGNSDAQSVSWPLLELEARAWLFLGEIYTVWALEEAKKTHASSRPVAVDYVKGRQYFEKAEGAARTYNAMRWAKESMVLSFACLRLAWMHQNGLGVAPDLHKARQYLESAKESALQTSDGRDQYNEASRMLQELE